MIGEASWTQCLNYRSVNEAYNAFVDKFKNLYGSYFSLLTRQSHKELESHWFLLAFLRMMKRKDRLYQSFLINRNPNDYVVFNQFRNKLNNKWREAKRNYYSEILTVNKNSKLVWRSINEVINKRNVMSNIRELIIDG